MLNQIADRLRWMYWGANRKFLEKFAETVVGTSESLHPNGARIINSLEAFLHTIPPNAFQQITLALAALPLSAPERWPGGDWRRLFLKIWLGIRSQFERQIFVSLSEERRAAKIDLLFHRLASQTPEQ